MTASVPGNVRLSYHVGDLDDDGHDTYAVIVADLDDLSDVTIASVTTGDRLRYNGSVWVNTTLTWEPMFDGTGLIMSDGLGNMMRHEVTY